MLILNFIYRLNISLLHPQLPLTEKKPTLMLNMFLSWKLKKNLVLFQVYFYVSRLLVQMEKFSMVV